MIKIWELYRDAHWVEPFLIFSICFFVGASAVLYLFIISSRNKNIKLEKLKKEHDQQIAELIFLVVFEDTPFLEIKKGEEYEKLSESFFFRKVLIESVINLHKNYDGVYAKKLEHFYKESGLINDSFKMLKSLKWEVKCKGITQLAEMNVTDSFERILTFSKARNKTLKITAINACIKLAGIKGITHLKAHPYPIDDWTQVNIIAAFKKHDIGDTKGVELLLESQNATVITLGLKLIKELKLTQKVPYVVQLAERTPNTLIQYEAQNVLQELTV
ncbi:hypothetical protein AAEO57_00590 [Flavobacterium sp. DGU38]|uniref:HEAT repeat domain-containing protein n=1 Tax=Flavobacterium calami TaxID=3139144 RepID=A0ABU9III7_9FLAO